MKICAPSPSPLYIYILALFDGPVPQAIFLFGRQMLFKALNSARVSHILLARFEGHEVLVFDWYSISSFQLDQIYCVISSPSWLPIKCAASCDGVDLSAASVLVHLFSGHKDFIVVTVFVVNTASITLFKKGDCAEKTGMIEFTQQWDQPTCGVNSQIDLELVLFLDPVCSQRITFLVFLRLNSAALSGPAFVEARAHFPKSAAGTEPRVLCLDVFHLDWKTRSWSSG